MAAATAVFQTLAPGDHVVASKVMYWALRSWLLTEAMRWGLNVDFAETDDLAALKNLVRPGATKVIWAETPSNPLWTITDIAAAADIAHAAGAKLAVDSTCASPDHRAAAVVTAGKDGLGQIDKPPHQVQAFDGQSRGHLVNDPPTLGFQIVYQRLSVVPVYERT
jgi:O-acetylhomoserine/O-acetylserine sulfhydrylase-like pyridoxal-dependent enzyme